jgi:hypothetical protein
VEGTSCADPRGLGEGPSGNSGRARSKRSVIDRLIFVPALALLLAGVFPHLLVMFTILNTSLAVGAWLLLGR